MCTNITYNCHKFTHKCHDFTYIGRKHVISDDVTDICELTDNNMLVMYMNMWHECVCFVHEYVTLMVHMCVLKSHMCATKVT